MMQYYFALGIQLSSFFNSAMYIDISPPPSMTSNTENTMPKMQKKKGQYRICVYKCTSTTFTAI